MLGIKPGLLGWNNSTLTTELHEIEVLVAWPLSLAIIYMSIYCKLVQVQFSLDSYNILVGGGAVLR